LVKISRRAPGPVMTALPDSDNLEGRRSCAPPDRQLTDGRRDDDPHERLDQEAVALHLTGDQAAEQRHVEAVHEQWFKLG
jgi:hypothetical protein